MIAVCVGVCVCLLVVGSNDKCLSACLCTQHAWGDRAVGAGLVAAGPIFSQLTCTKMPDELWWFVQLLR